MIRYLIGRPHENELEVREKPTMEEAYIDIVAEVIGEDKEGEIMVSDHLNSGTTSDNIIIFMNSNQINNLTDYNFSLGNDYTGRIPVFGTMVFGQMDVSDDQEDASFVTMNDANYDYCRLTFTGTKKAERESGFYQKVQDIIKVKGKVGYAISVEQEITKLQKEYEDLKNEGGEVPAPPAEPEI